METAIRLFEVGGCIRDEIMGISTKDIDFAVEAPSFDAMRQFLADEGFQIFVETPEFLTIRARFPKGHPRNTANITADFVLCRKERGSLDGRHPEHVETGTILDDLARRDFTVNAIARPLGEDVLLDPHNGLSDIQNKTIRFVGDPYDRIQEDALRVLRGIRFAVTKGFTLAPSTFSAFGTFNRDLLAVVSTERIKDELEKCFRHDTIATMRILDQFDLFELLFGREGIRLTTTLKG